MANFRLRASVLTILLYAAIMALSFDLVTDHCLDDLLCCQVVAAALATTALAIAIKHLQTGVDALFGFLLISVCLPGYPWLSLWEWNPLRFFSASLSPSFTVKYNDDIL